MAEVRERYDNLDGLRAISCLCIIAMHINANADYTLHPLLDTIIASWTHFVPLFLMISGFGMFCGYYERFKSGSINLNSFFTKRYKKILPFFITLILIDIVMDRSLTHVIEGITEATLVFGLLPNNQPEVIGVCWTLGIIFLFYMLFPFVVYLCWNKRRAWLTFIGSLVLSFFCSIYYFTDKFVIGEFVPRHSFLYCAPWLIVGGLIYLYRENIKTTISHYKWISIIIAFSITVIWYFIPGNINGIDIWVFKNLLVFVPWLMISISLKSKLLSNRVARYFSLISLELYLAQMILFRVVEKMNMLYIFGHDWKSLLFSFLIIVVGLVVFIEIWKRVFNFLSKYCRARGININE